jgi:hypothetical protein
MHANNDHAIVLLSPHMCDLNSRAYTGENYETYVEKNHRIGKLPDITQRS